MPPVSQTDTRSCHSHGWKTVSSTESECQQKQHQHEGTLQGHSPPREAGLLDPQTRTSAAATLSVNGEKCLLNGTCKLLHPWSLWICRSLVLMKPYDITESGFSIFIKWYIYNQNCIFKSTGTRPPVVFLQVMNPIPTKISQCWKKNGLCIHATYAAKNWKLKKQPCILHLGIHNNLIIIYLYVSKMSWMWKYLILPTKLPHKYTYLWYGQLRFPSVNTISQV